MNQAQIDKAAQILWNAWDNGETISELPKDCRPTDRQTAYKIQKEVGKLSRSSQIGWKIAATVTASTPLSSKTTLSISRQVS